MERGVADAVVAFLRAIAITAGLVLLAGAIALVAALFLLSQASFAHDAPSGWAYPLDCCSGYDCREVADAAIIEGPAGYVIRDTGEVIPMTDTKIRYSPDGKFHWCSRGGKPDGATICLFVPPRAF